METKIHGKKVQFFAIHKGSQDGTDLPDLGP